jgi:hypothetical protein
MRAGERRLARANWSMHRSGINLSIRIIRIDKVSTLARFLSLHSSKPGGGRRRASAGGSGASPGTSSAGSPNPAALRKSLHVANVHTGNNLKKEKIKVVKHYGIRSSTLLIDKTKRTVKKQVWAFPNEK